MKRMLLIGLLFSIILILSISVTASERTMVVLSELPDDECMLFLEENGIDMPPIFRSESAWLMFARSIIAQVEENPDMVVPYNAYVMHRCVREIKDAVNSYYGNSEIALYLRTRYDETLSSSTAYGGWTDEYGSYGSYVYAIDYYIPYETIWGDSLEYDPGQIWWMLNGNDPEDYYFNEIANAETLKDMVVLDLQKLGYVVSASSTVMPDTIADDHTKLICLRKDEDGVPTGDDSDGNMRYWYDYHFMKLGNDGYWYHKPNQTNPLRYNYLPSYDRIWVNEGYHGYDQEYYCNNGITYESAIWFIEYTTPHVWEYIFWETGEHIERCTICGEERLADCQWGTTAVYVGLNSHQYTCKLCGGLGNSELCTKEYKHFEDDADHHWHLETCTVCNSPNGPHEVCTIEIIDNGDGTHTTACGVCGFERTAACKYQCNYSGSGSTHTTTCADCDHSVTEACTFVCRYAGRVNGKNTHINVCSSCGYSALGATQCMYNSSGVCRFCKTPESYSPINRGKEEILTE